MRDFLPPLRWCEQFDWDLAWWLAEFSRWSYNHLFVEPIASQGWEIRAQSRQHPDLGVLLRHQSARLQILVFRGTVGRDAWKRNFQLRLIPWDRGRVHQGFAHSLDNIWSALEQDIDSHAPLLICGHSLGGALATLALSRLLHQGRIQRQLAQVYSFGAPRPGDPEFCASVESSAVHRVVNGRDLVPQLPFRRGLGLEYAHPGQRYPIGDGLRHDTGPGGPPRRFADHAPINYVYQCGPPLRWTSLR